MVLEIGLLCGQIKNSDIIFSGLGSYDGGPLYLSERTTTTICCTPTFVYIYTYVY